jgi:hypothetical protein
VDDPDVADRPDVFDARVDVAELLLRERARGTQGEEDQ